MLFAYAFHEDTHANDQSKVESVAPIHQVSTAIEAQETTTVLPVTDVRLSKSEASSTIQVEESVDDTPVEPSIQKHNQSTETKEVVSEEVAKLPPSTLEDEDDEPYALLLSRLIFEKTNAFRTAHNKEPLQDQNALHQSAEEYSKKLHRDGILAHTDKSGCDMTCRFNQNNYNARSWGENLARIEFKELPSAETIVDFFMREWEKSSGHRENLLSPTFTHQGIGVSVSNDAVYAVVHFAKPL